MLLPVLLSRLYCQGLSPVAVSLAVMDGGRVLRSHVKVQPLYRPPWVTGEVSVQRSPITFRNSCSVVSCRGWHVFDWLLVLSVCLHSLFVSLSLAPHRSLIWTILKLFVARQWIFIDTTVLMINHTVALYLKRKKNIHQFPQRQIQRGMLMLSVLQQTFPWCRLFSTTKKCPSSIHGYRNQETFLLNLGTV